MQSGLPVWPEGLIFYGVRFAVERAEPDIDNPGGVWYRYSRIEIVPRVRNRHGPSHLIGSIFPGRGAQAPRKRGLFGMLTIWKGPSL